MHAVRRRNRSDRIQLKTPDQIEKMRAAGLVVAEALAPDAGGCRPRVSAPPISTPSPRRPSASAGGVPSFKGYHGFPASICSSVNEQVVHAIPSPSRCCGGRPDLLDCGAVLDGWHGDSAITVGVGDVDPALLKMAEVAEDAMWAGIAAAARGCGSGKGRLTDISSPVETAVRKAGRYGIVDGYGGHGIGTEMHQDPHVLNHGRPGKGPRLVPGMALAIEPMITMGSPGPWSSPTAGPSSPATARWPRTSSTRWRCCDDGVWVLTAFDGGRARLGDLVTAQPKLAAAGAAAAADRQRRTPHARRDSTCAAPSTGRRRPLRRPGGRWQHWSRRHRPASYGGECWRASSGRLLPARRRSSSLAVACLSDDRGRVARPRDSTGCGGGRPLRVAPRRGPAGICAEYESGCSRAYAARTYADLEALLSDLPPVPRRSGRPWRRQPVASAPGDRAAGPAPRRTGGDAAPAGWPRCGAVCRG